MIVPALGLGVLLGMRHALEADHVALQAPDPRLQTQGVGSLHGLAGTGALVVLALQTPGGRAFRYLGVFGGGAILGMMAFSVSFAVPFELLARCLRGWSSSGLGWLVGVTNLVIGGWLAARAWL